MSAKKFIDGTAWRDARGTPTTCGTLYAAPPGSGAVRLRELRGRFSAPSFAAAERSGSRRSSGGSGDKDPAATTATAATVLPMMAVGAAQLLPRSALDFELTTRNATTGAQSARLTPHLDRDGDLLYSAVLYAQLQ